MIQTNNTEIIVIFNNNGLQLDTDYTSNKNFYYNETLINNYNENPMKSFLYFGFEDFNDNMSLSLACLHKLTQAFVYSLSKNPDIELTKKAEPITFEKCLEFLKIAPFVATIEYVTVDWVTNFWSELCKVFESEIKNFDGTVFEYLKSFNSNLNMAGRIYFHLVENTANESPFAFLATYSTKENDKVKHMPLKHSLLEYKDNQNLLLQLLGTVSKAANESRFISGLVESGELFHPLGLKTDEAYTFLKEIPLYESCGILCRMPDWWKRKSSSAKISVSLGDKQPSKLGLDELVKVDPKISIGGQNITKDELKSLLAETEGLSFLKGKWIEVDHEKLKDILKTYESLNEQEDVTLSDAIRAQLGLSSKLDILEDDNIEFTNGEWLDSVRDKLLNPSKIEDIKISNDFKATLRNYQQLGFNWLFTMKSLGFGALLADDMGLGKTIQILALLEHLRQKSDFKTLLVIPTSLLGNWKNEIEKFAPKLTYKIIHGKQTDFDLNDANIFITTYGMVTRLDFLKNYKWDVLVLDEAQAIKNPSTKQTKEVKFLQADFKIAMTGTPVENKLADLWSIFDFLNKGLLGSTKEFSSFIKKIQKEESYVKLKNVITPFILRRLKTDKFIINDLPDKIEMKSYATLTKKQVVLYNALIKELTEKLEKSEGIERKGLVLGAIIKFKQICNHPDQYLGLSNYELSHSGKFDKLKEICETIKDKKERVLVFTQFREITEPLANFLSTIWNREGFVLHGGTAAKKRTEMVEQFNKEYYTPFMVLSLKAGGVGLNLTSANHVIHFDRWWNPAIENQATDRVFRIGQQKNVLVHKFITEGTIEEKIDEMIEEKQKLANEIIASSGESWITEMSNKDLLNLFKLS